MQKEKKRSRPIQMLVMLSEKEKMELHQKMDASGEKKIGPFVRKMIKDGKINTIDFSHLKSSLSETGKFTYEINRIGNNINQVAKKVNESDLVDQADVKYLVEEVQSMKKNYEAAVKILSQEINRLIKRK